MGLFGHKKETKVRVKEDRVREDGKKEEEIKEEGMREEEIKEKDMKEEIKEKGIREERIGVERVEKPSGCCCGGTCNEDSVEAAKELLSSGANVKVLGGGCNKCNALERNVREALKELGMNDEIEHVTDFGQIAAMGIMRTPALMIDNKVVSLGKVLSKEEAVKALKKVRG